MEPGGPILLILDPGRDAHPRHGGAARRAPDFAVGPYAVYRRPRLAEFLSTCSASFRLAVWSVATEEFVRPVIERILPTGVELAFAWGRSRCVRQSYSEPFEEYDVKDLKKVKRLGYRLERVLIADDTPRKVHRRHGNAVYFPPFLGEPRDEALPGLGRFLASLRYVPNVRRVEKRGWLRGV